MVSLELVKKKMTLFSFTASLRQRALLEVVQTVSFEPSAKTALLKSTSNLLYCCCLFLQELCCLCKALALSSLSLYPAVKPEVLLVLCGCCLRTSAPRKNGGICFLWFTSVFGVSLDEERILSNQ